MKNPPFLFLRTSCLTQTPQVAQSDLEAILCYVRSRGKKIYKSFVCKAFFCFILLYASYANLCIASAEINLKAIAFIESSNNPRAINKLDHGGIGSRGLFQISDALRRDYNRLNKKSVSPQDLFIPEINTSIAKWAFDFYYPLILKKTLRLSVTTENLIICHNAGCGALKRSSLNKTTKNYLKKYRSLVNE